MSDNAERRLSIRLPAETGRMLQHWSKRLGIPQSNLIAALIVEILPDLQKIAAMTDHAVRGATGRTTRAVKQSLNRALSEQVHQDPGSKPTAP